jgi:hypothetical protein
MSAPTAICDGRFPHALDRAPGRVLRPAVLAVATVDDGSGVRPIPLIALSVGLAYGGGAWLHLLHEAEGAFEPAAPHPVLHWLRDSSLALPLVVAAVWFALRLADNLIEPSAKPSSRLASGALIATLVTLSVSIVMGMGNPIHGFLFSAEHHVDGQQLSPLVHVARDSILAFIGNLPIAAYVTAVVGVAGRDHAMNRPLS